MSLRTRWIKVIYNVATGTRRTRTLLTPLVGLSYVLIASLFVFFSFSVDRLFHFPQLIPTPLNKFLCMPVIGIGVSIILWSQFHFFKEKGTPVPFNPPPKLVTTGPYAYTRNPMLTGIFILLWGFGIVFGSVSLIFIFTPLFILINVTELKMIEEPELEKRLGPDYVRYKEKTPMFFPRIWLGFGK